VADRASIRDLLRRTARVDPERLRGGSRRFAAWFLLASIVGATTGLVVVGFQVVVLDLLWRRVLLADPWVWMVAPGVGLVLAWVVLRIFRARSSATSEEYIRVFHDRRARTRLLDVPAKLLAGVSTIGLGGSVGLEGPSLFSGGAIGEALQRLAPGFWRREEARVLMVAGGAAGVAAVFKAPLTGLVFAMEVPYRDDIARHVLGPALVASASAYLVEAGFRGTSPLVPIFGRPEFGPRDLILAIAVGLLAGLVGRALIVVFRSITGFMSRLSPIRRLALAGGALTIIAALSYVLYEAPIALGPGEEAIRAAAVGGLSVVSLVALLALKAIATSVTVGAGGVGGIFFPIVVMGSALGAILGEFTPSTEGNLLPMVGMAALLGATYHTPLAGVSFVAEATGSVGFIIPTFVATAAAYATIGRASISTLQRARRAGALDLILDVPVSDVLSEEIVAVPTSETLEGFVERFALRHRFDTFPVVDRDGLYAGTVDIDHAAAVPGAERDSTPVGRVVATDGPVGRRDWTVRSAIEAMAEADADILPIVDDSGHLAGVVVASEVFQLDELLERLRTERGEAGGSAS
jgi:CIC family chloride channel protein